MVSEQGIEKPRLKSLETEVSSLAVSEERMVKEMQESSQQWMPDLIQCLVAELVSKVNVLIMQHIIAVEKETLVDEAAKKIFFNSHLSRTIKLDFICFNGSDDPTRPNWFAIILP